MSNKKNDKDPKKNQSNNEEFKKKKRFDDDPLVRKYTDTGYRSFKADDAKKEEDESKGKKYSHDFADIPRSPEYNYQPNFRHKQLDGDEYKKGRKDVSGILSDMFGSKKDSMPFGNVQYQDHANRIQTGSSGRRARRSRSRSSSKKVERASSPKESPKVDKSKTDESEKEKLASLKVIIESMIDAL